MSTNIYRDTATLAMEGDVAAMADDLRADLDQLLAQTGQRPRVSRPRHRQRPHKVAEVEGQYVPMRNR
jgi:hypothetical protein